MESKNYPVERILRISQGIDLLDDNNAIDATTSYRVGRIGDSCVSVKRRLEKAQNKLINEFNKQRTSLVGKVEEKDLTQEVKDQITELANKLNEDVSLLQDQEDTINIVALSLNDFKAKEDIKVKVQLTNPDKSIRLEEISYKKDQLIVSNKFLKLMGDLISE
jgi:predicted DsbA family dithiol-disulfide isomerase